MFSMRKILFVIVFAVLLFSPNAAETILVPENSLLLKGSNENKTWTVKAVVRRDFQGEVTKKEKVFLQQEGIGICVDAYHLKIPGTDGLSYFPEIVFKKDKNGIVTPNVDKIGKIDSLMFLGIFLFTLGLVALAGFLRLKSEKKNYLLPATLLLFFWGYASWYIGFISNFIITPYDEIYYFKIAHYLLSLDFSSTQYYYTIGFPICCIPFVLLFHIEYWLDFILIYMNFQTFILIPGLFLLLYRLFYKKMGVSRIQSFSILLLWLIMIVFYMPVYTMIDPASQFVPGCYIGNANFALTDREIYYSFIQMTWLGRNAMSDYATVFLFIILLYASIKKSTSLLRFFILSMGFGFLCLVRINYIFFAPLFAFVFYDSFPELWKMKRNYLYAALCGTAGFMIVFGWQFVLNKMHFGSPFVWPYSLHDFAPDRGFVLKVVPYGFEFLCQTNYVYMILGISSLFFIPERKNRVILTLWIFPMFFFFSGYPNVYNSMIRFIFALYAPLLAAVVMNPVWKAAWSVRLKAALVVTSSCVLCKSNIFFCQFQPWNLGKLGIPNGFFIISQCVVCLFCCAVIFSMRKELKADYANTIRHVRFLILFTAVFFLGSVCVYIAGLLILAAFVCGLRDTWVIIRQIYGGNGIDDPSLTA